MKIDERYMSRALELARMGEIGAHPNPMVGAVIVGPDGQIFGEGYHQTCGQAHAEVNAVRAAEGADLTDATIYVTLEPCAHWGKTPPCAQLLIDRKIPRVVVGTVDPFAKVHGKGIQMLREAGAEVEILTGKIADECRWLNRRFFTAHTLSRPYIALKWARTADGFVDYDRKVESGEWRADSIPLKLSTAATQTAMHRYRSTFDAIAVGSNTLHLDRPRLDARLWPGGRNPQRVEFHRGDLVPQLAELYCQGISSLLVEGGPTLQQAFFNAGLWDEVRIETSPQPIGTGIPAPTLPSSAVAHEQTRNIQIMLNGELLRRFGRL